MPQLAGPWGRRIPSPLNEVVVRIFLPFTCLPASSASLSNVDRSTHATPTHHPPKFLHTHHPPTRVHTQAVSHLKALVFDDTLILTGANLSRDYFTNRQDRYVAIQVQAQAQAQAQTGRTSLT